MVSICFHLSGAWIYRTHLTYVYTVFDKKCSTDDVYRIYLAVMGISHPDVCNLRLHLDKHRGRGIGRPWNKPKGEYTWRCKGISKKFGKQLNNIRNHDKDMSAVKVLSPHIPHVGFITSLFYLFQCYVAEFPRPVPHSLPRLFHRCSLIFLI